MTIINSDDQSTWPTELRQAVERHEAEIRSYHLERAAIDRSAQDDVTLRIDRPENSFEPIWNRVLAVANAALEGQYLLGYHASRLTEDDVSSIKTSGLEVLSVNLLNRRLEALRDAGQLTEQLFASLSARHQAADDNRANKIWFVFVAATLKDESGMERFFRSWGGEALYNSHEDHRLTGPALRSQGGPAIVQAAVPCNGIQCFMEIGTRLVNIWCASKGIRTGHQAEFEGYVSTAIAAAHILRIDMLGSDTFERLTNQHNWRKPLARR